MKNPTPGLQKLIDADPDLVDRIFEYLLTELPELAGLSARIKSAVRAEFAGEECYIAGRPATARQELVSQVLSLFNGRNASEVARRLNISRATVYRIIKQPGQDKKKSHVSGT
ncbi:MAG: Mor transcription activator family protein [Ottowia sp.]|uniref:Mor transcription activator family protein n=1 Tax=Ottowia sp. TaxID=1898956 RepID=UPI003C78866E